jgi:hypothetical protein
MTKKGSKQVVYLFGAGATQAEISLVDDTIHILTDDIREGIRNEVSGDVSLKNENPALINELSNENLDVEHLITLYESSGNNKHSQIARCLRKLFREQIQEKLKKLGSGSFPKLYPALIDMHEISGLNEKIAGIITLNYEDLLERGVQKIKNGINYSIQMSKGHSFLKIKKKLGFPILKLHGSFNWKNEFPVTLMDDDKIENPEDVLWIPPGVEKKMGNYPFNILWGRAREILNCDILRVIGCSLNRNDWQLISLLYTTQKLKTRGRGYTIELINRHHVCNRIKEDYSYLNLRLMSDILEVRESIARSMSVASDDKKSMTVEQYLDGERLNFFDIWLRSKGEHLQAKGISIATSVGAFENYIKEKS